MSTFFRLVLPLLLSVLAVTSVRAQMADPLAALKWEKRPLLLFAKSRSDASLDRQVDILRDRRPDLEERDMVVLQTAGQEETRSAIGYTPIRAGMGRNLRQRYRPAERGLTIILIGKDGAEKKRWNRLVQPEEIFDIIDAMPMRQREMGEES